MPTYRKLALTVAAMICGAALFVLSACGRGPAQARSLPESLFQEERALYRDYMKGDTKDARRALQELIRRFEDADPTASPGVRIGILCWHSARLFALERRTGDETAADQALIRARYWSLRRFEWEQQQPHAMPLTSYATMTPERMLSDVDKLDRGANFGRSPKYLEAIENRGSERFHLPKEPNK